MTAATKKAVATTADWLIYAIGGGLGHARRGWLLQHLLAQAGRTAILLVRPDSDRHLPAATLPRACGGSLADPHLADLVHRPPRGIVADTFPRGWHGELNEELLGRFETRVWLARHSRSHGVADAVNYHRVLSPYPAGGCEWDGQLPTARHAGYLVDSSHLDLRPDPRRFVLVDSEGRCNPRLLGIFRAEAQRAGLEFHLQHRLHDPIHAAKLLLVGAGYHSFYECLGQDVDVRFLPVAKRHDDQHRRARRFGCALDTLDELMPWLASPCNRPALDARMDGDTVLAALGIAGKLTHPG
jgi:hypothetical protein